jgi:hypothetical protein
MLSWPGLEFRLGLALLYVIVAVRLIMKNRNMIFYLPVLIYAVAGFVSVLAIESGAYVLEEGRTGFENGAFSVYYIFVVSTMFVIYYTIRKMKISIEFENNRTLFYVYSLIYALLVSYAISRNTGFTRFDIFNAFPVSLRRFVIFVDMGYGYIYFYSLMKERSLQVKMKYFLIFAVLLHIRGVEFGELLEAVVFLAIAIVLQSGGKKQRKEFSSKAIWSAGAIVALGMMAAAYVKISSVGNLANFLNRLVLQNHVLWGTMNVLKEQKADTGFSVYLAHFFSLAPFSTNLQYGLGKLMVAISGNYAADLIQGGARFTGGYPAIMIYQFGYFVAFLINILLTYVFVQTIRFRFHLLNRYNFLIFAIGAKLLDSFSELYNMGEYGSFNIKFLFACAFLLLLISSFGPKRHRKRKGVVLGNSLPLQSA